MISIFFKNIVFDNKIDLSRSNAVYIEVSGHSDLNKKGSDILCSAVSALTQTFILTIERVLKIKQQIIRDDGFLATSVTTEGITAEDRSGLKLLIESLLIGLLEINGEYPGRIKIEFVND